MTQHLLQEMSKDSSYAQMSFCCGQRTCQDNILALRDRVGQLSEAMQQIDFQIKNLTEVGPKMSKDELLTKLMELPDYMTLLNPNTKNFSLDSNLFSFKDSVGLDSTLSFNSGSRIYEVPVQMDLSPVDSNPEQNELDVEDISDYFKGFQKWADLPSKIQKTLADLLKTQSAENSLKLKNKQSYFYPLDTSLLKSENLSEESNLEESMNLSEIKNMKKLTTQETVNKHYQQQEIQTEQIRSSIQECRIPEDQNDSDWFQAQESVNKIKEMFTQIPSQIFTDKITVNIEQVKNTEEFPLTPNEEAMQSILIEVDDVLGSIQQMLYQLPDEIFEEQESYEEEVIQIEDIYAMEEEVLRKEKSSEQTWNQADLSMSRLSQLILDIPQSNNKFMEFNPQIIVEDDDQSSHEREIFDSDDQNVQESVYKGDIEAEKKIFNMDPGTEIFDEINTSFTNLANLRKQLYNIPIEFEVLDNSEYDCNLSFEELPLGKEFTVQEARLDSKMFEINDNILWKEVDGKLEMIQKFIEESPVNVNQIFDYTPPQDLFVKEKAVVDKKEEVVYEMNQKFEGEEEADSQKIREEKIKWARIENYDNQCDTWEKIDGGFLQIKKLFYEVPLECHNFEASQAEYQEQFIQTEIYQQQYQTLAIMAESVDSCDITAEENTDWDDLNGRIAQIHRRLVQEPELFHKIEKRRKTSDQLLQMKIEQLPISHEQYLIANYDIPIDLEIQSEISSDTCSQMDDLEECMEEDFEAEGQQFEESQMPVEVNFKETARINARQRVTIQNYQIPLQMDLIEDLQEEEKVILQTVSLKQDKFILQSNVLSHTILHKKPKQVFEIPIEMTIYEDFDEEDLEENFPIMCKCSTQETQTFTDISETKGPKEKDFEISCSVELALEGNKAEEQKQLIEIEALDLKENSIFDRSENRSKKDDNSISLQSPRKNALNMSSFDLKFKSPATSRKNYYLMDLESSEGNRTDRSLYNRRSLLGGFSKFQDTNSLASKIIKEQNINAADFYELAEERNLLEDEKNKLCEMLEILNEEVEQLRNKNKTQVNFIEAAKNLYKKQKTQMAFQLSNFELRMFELERDLGAKQSEVQILEEEKEQLEQRVVKLSNQIGQKRVLISEFDDDFKEMKVNMEDEIKYLKEQLEERTKQFAERERQNSQEIEVLKLQLHDMRENNSWMKKENEKILRNIEQLNNEKIQLTVRHNDLIGNLETIINEKQDKFSEKQMNSAFKVYEGEFRKSMLLAERELEQKDKQIAYLQTEIKIYEGKLVNISEEKDKMIQQQHEVIQQLSEKLEITDTAFKNSYHIPSQLQVELDYLRRQLIQATEQVIQKENFCMEMRMEIERMKERSEKSMSINFDRSFSEFSTPEKKEENRDDYIRQLEEIIYEHEKIIMNNQNEIKDLQEKVCEYLGDAIEKEEELQYFQEFLEGSEQNSDEAEEAIVRLDNAAKYLLMMNKKNYPSYVGVQEPLPSPMEVSRLSIEDSTVHDKILGPDSTTQTRVILPRNQSADDSCLYAKARLIDSRKKKALNQTMNERKKQAIFTRR